MIAHIKANYRLCGEISGAPIDEGMAENFLIKADDSKWLLKVFQDGYTDSRVLAAAKFVGYLRGKGLYVEPFVRTKDGNTLSILNRRPAVLVPWIEGENLRPNTVTTREQMSIIGDLCGRIHAEAACYGGKRELNSYNIETDLKQALETLSKMKVYALNIGDDELLAEIDSRLIVMKREGDSLVRSQARCTHDVIHGDFYCTHVIFQARGVYGIIDVIGQVYNQEWEIMRSFFQSLSASAEHEINMLWNVFIEAYRKWRFVPSSLLRAGYDAYLLQLCASSFGLLTADKINSPQSVRLRQYGQWRTKQVAKLLHYREEKNFDFF